MAAALQHLPLHLGALDVVGQQPARAGQNAPARYARALLGALEEHLHADAYADEGGAGGDHLVGHLVEAASAPRLHAPAEAAAAREDPPGGLPDPVTGSGEADVGPAVLERLLARAGGSEERGGGDKWG